VSGGGHTEDHDGEEPGRQATPRERHGSGS
jgi:hypothetical protein